MKLNHYMAYLRVAVDEYEEGRLAGSVYSQRLPEPFLFKNTADLLLRIEDLLDAQDFPRAFQRKRTFSDKTPARARGGDGEDGGEARYMDEAAVNQAKGKLCTFAVNIITRQNTSWQGYLDWLDGAERAAFNSDLELLGMITERLSQ